MSILFKDCIILSREGGIYKAEAGFLGVEGKYIDYVGKEKPAKKYRLEKSMGGALLMPGLVNAHGHSAMTLLRGVGSDLSLQDWLFGKILPIEEKMDAEDVLWGTRMAIMEMIACGTTAFAEMYSFPVEAACAVRESGMKANICRPIFCTDPDTAWEDCERLLETPEYLRRIKEAGGDRVTADFCLHSEYMSSRSIVEKYAEMAGEYPVRMHLHLSETRREHEECIMRHGLTPMAYFESLGVFRVPAYAAHCVWISGEDMEIAERNGVTIVHNPTSNMKLGSGFAPIPKALKAGVNVALGTDGCASNNNLNMWEEMHLAGIIHKGYGNDPVAVNQHQVLDMATLNGARALGLEDSGELGVGKKADIIAVDMNALHMQPAFDVPSLLVYSAQGSDVLMTMADGEVLYEDGEFLTMDRESIVSHFAASCRKLLGV